MLWGCVLILFMCFDLAFLSHDKLNRKLLDLNIPELEKEGPYFSVIKSLCLLRGSFLAHGEAIFF